MGNILTQDSIFKWLFCSFVCKQDMGTLFLTYSRISTKSFIFLYAGHIILLLHQGFSIRDICTVHPYSSVVKHPAANAGDMGSIPGSGRPLGVGNGNPLQYACLGSPMDRGARWPAVHGVRVQREWAHVHVCTAHQCCFRAGPVLTQECLLLVHDTKVKVSF